MSDSQSVHSPSADEQGAGQEKKDINKLVTAASDIQKVLKGQKTAQRRNGRYADPGDTFELEGRKFVVSKVFRQTLGELTDEDAKAEGFENLEAYKSVILSLHPGMPWLPHMKVLTHLFEMKS